MELLFETIASEIENGIKSRQYLPGEKLPAERMIAQKYCVSRGVVREAFKVLKEKGLIVSMTGRGAFVTSPQEEDIVDKLESVMDLGRIPYMDILNAREEMEVVVGKLLMKNITDEEYATLDWIAEQMQKNLGNIRQFEDYDTKFHLQIAKCSKNEALRLLTLTINNISDRDVFWDKQHSRAIRERAQKDHKLMLKAILLRDEALYESAIRKHIGHIKEHVLKLQAEGGQTDPNERKDRSGDDEQ